MQPFAFRNGQTILNRPKSYDPQGYRNTTRIPSFLTVLEWVPPQYTPSPRREVNFLTNNTGLDRCPQENMNSTPESLFFSSNSVKVQNSANLFPNFLFLSPNFKRHQNSANSTQKYSTFMVDKVSEQFSEHFTQDFLHC